MTTVEYRVYNPANTSFLGTLTRAYGKTYVDALSAPGLGRFTIDLDDPQAALVQPRRVVRVRIDGTDRFAFIIDDMPRDEVGDADHGPSMQVSGPGLVGWLGTGRGGALIYPPRYRTRATNRAFGWHSLDYPRPAGDGWTNPGVTNTMGRYEKPSSHMPRLVGTPPGWPDRRAEWITHRSPTYFDDGRVIQFGSNRMLLSRHLPATGAEEPARIYCAGTNEWDLYFDGERVASGGGFRNVVETDVFLENRPMALGVDVRHERTPGFKYDMLLFILSIHRIDENGNRAGVLFRTYTPGQQPAPQPSQFWRLLADPTVVPGLNAGRILRTLLDEAKARGTIPSLNVSSFSPFVDSNGQPWAEEITHSFPIGTKLSDVLEQVVGLTGVEYTVTPAGQLRVVNRLGVARAGAFAPLVSGRASGEGVRATVLLGQAEDGFLQRTHAAGVTTYGRIEDAVTLGTTPSRLSLARPLDRMLTYTARIRDERDYVLSHDSPQPYAQFGLGDTFTDGRVTQIAMSQEDANGAVEWAVSLLPEGT